MTWTPGFRRVPPKLKARIGDHMLAILDMGRIKGWVVKNGFSKDTEIDLDDDSPKEEGDDISLSLAVGHGKVSINLSALNEEELLTLARAIKYAFQIARPIVRERDRVAKEAADNGEDLFFRRHRSTPRLSIFERSSGKHSAGVPGRPQNVLAGDESGGDQPS